MRGAPQYGRGPPFGYEGTSPGRQGRQQHPHWMGGVSPHRGGPQVHFQEEVYDGRSSRGGSPGKESVHTLGEPEREVLSGVIARLQHGIGLAGEAGSYTSRPASSSWTVEGGSDLDKLRTKLSNPLGTSSESVNSIRELRSQLDRAGIVIAQQLETSARKDILMEEHELRFKIERLSANTQIERIYDVLTEERSDRCAAEEALVEQLDAVNGEKQRLVTEGREISSEGKRVLDQTVYEYEDRIKAAVESYEEALSEMQRKQDESRKQTRQELEEAAGNTEVASELLRLQLQEADERIELSENAFAECFETALDVNDGSFRIMLAGPGMSDLAEMHHRLNQHETAEELRREDDVRTLETKLEEARQTIVQLQQEETRLKTECQKLLQITAAQQETAKLQVEGRLRKEMSDLSRMRSRDEQFVLEELIFTQQETGRYAIMLSQLQELLAFILTRYAPHLMDATPEDIDPLKLHPGTKHTSIYPSYWGWMFRSTGMFVSWQRRFFLLRDGVLKFGTQDNGNLQPLLNVESIARVELDSFNDAAQGNHPPTGKYESFGFMVETYSKQRVRFCCTSSSERAEWMSVLRKSIEIRLNTERQRAFNPTSEAPYEPYLYLEDCSPPDPPPTYRTRVRLADCGAYPMLGPGSPPRSRLPSVLPVHSMAPPSERPPTSPKRGNPMRPTLLSTVTSTPKGGSTMGPVQRYGPGQAGGASGVGASHGAGFVGRKGIRQRSQAIVQTHATAAAQQRNGRQGRQAALLQHAATVSQLSKGSRRTSRMGSATNSECVADAFEGTVPVDVLLVKTPPLASEAQAYGLTDGVARHARATAHAFHAKFRDSYDKTQIYYGGGNTATDLSSVYREVLRTQDPPLMLDMSRGHSGTVLKILNNMVAQPVVAGSPLSLLCVLVGPEEAIDHLTAALDAEGETTEPLAEYSAALYSSLFAAHRNGVSWSLVTRIDGTRGIAGDSEEDE
ncbi:hypothetical protein DIPPA_04797 [Diplonema papillatum]|nr:hypothetical protein DIPPA_04797 [Diplonema papillatum]